MAEPDTAAYPPLDTVKPVADGLWIVDSGPLNAAGLTVPIRMTVVRLASGDVLLHSPTRFTTALRDQIAKIGPIRHLVAPNIAHWIYIKAWQEAVAEAAVWAAPGLGSRGPVRRAGLRIDHELSDTPPPVWRDDLDQAVFRGGFGVNEVAFLHRPSRTLILTDLVQNFEPGKVKGVERFLLTVAGSVAPKGKTPLHIRIAMNRNRGAVAKTARRVIAWEPERIILAHGRWIERDGTAELRRRLDWLV